MELRNRKIAATPTTPRTRRARSSAMGALSETSMAAEGTTEAPSETTSLAPREERVAKAVVVEPKASIFRRVLAWSVHLYTALGLLINAYSLHVALYGGGDGGAPSFALFARLNWLAILVDATDGTLARRFDVKLWAKGVDGALLDNIIDFQTFALLPALAVVVFDVVPGARAQYAVATSILIAAGFQFCQAMAKTEQAFVGFPSYWNILLFYVYYLRPNTALTLALFFGCAALSFVPIHFVYPTRTEKFFKVNIGGAYLWGALMIVPSMYPQWKYATLCMRLSLIYVAYYFGVSLYLDAQRRAAERAHLSTCTTQ